MASEVGGRWSDTCAFWVRNLAAHKASENLRHLQKAIEFSWHARWWSLLSVTAANAVAASMTDVTFSEFFVRDFEPTNGEVLSDARYELGPVVSRLPLRCK